MGISETTENFNLFHENCFLMVFGFAPEFPLWVQETNLPGIQGNTPNTANPRFRDVKYPGNGISFGNFECSFLVDEDLNQWLFMYEWIMRSHVGHGYCDIPGLYNFDRQAWLNHKEDVIQSSTVTLFLTTNKFNTNLKVVLGRAYPSDLSGLALRTNTDDAKQLTSDVQFQFNNIGFERVNPVTDPLLQDPKVKAFLEQHRRKIAGQGQLD